MITVELTANDIQAILSCIELARCEGQWSDEETDLETMLQEKLEKESNS